MKITRLFLAFFVCLTLVFANCGPDRRTDDLPGTLGTSARVDTEASEPIKPTEPTRPTEPTQPTVPNTQSNRIAVSEDFLKTRDPFEISLAKFYISADTQFMMYTNQYYDRVGVDGIYYTNTVPESKPVLIKKDDQGTFVQNINNWEKIEVKFSKDEDIFLTFLRVRNTYQYELNSARTEKISLSLPTFKSDKPLLQIYHISGPNPNPIPYPTINPAPNPNIYPPPNPLPPYYDNKNPQPLPNPYPYKEERYEKSFSDINNVLDTGNLTRADISAIADFICAQRRPTRIPYSVAGSGFDRSSVVEIITFYFVEAEREGINPDLAIAQVIQNLQYFSDSKRYINLRQAHNYGAITGLKANDYWTGSRFINRQIGIRAHIQFLKRSASGNLNDRRTTIVLPMSIWNNLANVAGNRKTLNAISQSWGGSGYANNIRDIYRSLFEYVSARR